MAECDTIPNHKNEIPNMLTSHAPYKTIIAKKLLFQSDLSGFIRNSVTIYGHAGLLKTWYLFCITLIIE